VFGRGGRGGFAPRARGRFALPAVIVIVGLRAGGGAVFPGGIAGRGLVPVIAVPVGAVPVAAAPVTPAPAAPAPATAAAAAFAFAVAVVLPWAAGGRFGFGLDILFQFGHVGHVDALHGGAGGLVALLVAFARAAQDLDLILRLDHAVVGVDEHADVVPLLQRREHRALVV